MKSHFKIHTRAALVLSALMATTAIAYSDICTVDWNEVHQRIDGFGASSAWHGPFTTAQVSILFSTNDNISYTDNLGRHTTDNGIGLSLLRSHISYASSTSSNAVPSSGEIAIMQTAQAMGVKVWSSPWTPPVGFKDSGVQDGGNYLGSGNNATNLAYASQLANYVANMKSNGINLYAVSVQNEPDGNHPDPGGYESCLWSGQQIHDFIINLHKAMAAANVTSTMIMLPESQNWGDPENLGGLTMNDPNTAADVGIIANHDYVGNNAVGDTSAPAVVPTYGKALWETEVSLLSGSDGSITNGVYYATRVHEFMVAGANAFNYWYLIASGYGNEGLLDTFAAPTKRLFAIGQFSRFIRPNYYRIGADAAGYAHLLISAYKDPASSNFVIVAVNSIPNPITQVFNLTNFDAFSVTPWITSSTLSLASQPSIAITNGSFTYVIPSRNVITFVGQAVANRPPTLAPVADQTLNVGETLTVTNTATDPDLPFQTLTFSPANTLPPNANLDSSSGIFSWRAPVSLANTTNTISLQVTDNGSPDLSATNSFNVAVNPITNPVVGLVSVSGGQVNMTVSGPQGPDYTLWTSTNLVDWDALFTTNAPPIPFTLVDTNFTDSARFYRLQIGP
jgi:glucuronoarabinoxylan endo-1,4-beta-xylanase